MAFPGHSRSLDLSHTPSTDYHVESSQHDKPRHPRPDHVSPKDPKSARANRFTSHYMQQEANGRMYDDDYDAENIAQDRTGSGGSFTLETDDIGNKPTTSLWVGNVPPGLKDDDLWVAFKGYGPILSVRATPHKRCGFVNFKQIDAAISAWRDCHERDIFRTGWPVYVRYEDPPIWLREKHSSLKRKRASADAFVPNTPEVPNRPVPTGPRSRVMQTMPRSGPRSQQRSISPPPLRQHDLYRPHSPSGRSRINSHSSLAENGQLATSRTVEPTDLSGGSVRRPDQDPENAESGVGIKDPAASRKGSSAIFQEPHNGQLPGFQIKGTATQANTGAEEPAASATDEGSDLASSAKPKASSHSNTAKFEKHSLSILCETSRSLSASGENAVLGKELPESLTGLKKTSKSALEPSAAKERLGFAHLSHLFEVKEQEEVMARKARTISPLCCVRESSGDTASVKSAQTDPTPVVKWSAPNADVCDSCNIGGGLFRLFKCSVPSCSRKIHSMCGSSTTLYSLDQKTKFVCDQCSRDSDLTATKPVSTSLGEDVQLETSDDTSESHGSVTVQSADTSLTTASVHDSAAKVEVDAGRGAACSNQGIHADTFGPLVKPTPAPSGKMPGHGQSIEQAVTSRGAKEGPLAAQVVQRRGPPPTEPRSMREAESTVSPLETARRYKTEVTCPWWKKGNKCVRRAEDCIFAHRATGIESPNGHSIAKDWTCYDFGTPRGCRFTEKECLYSHRDTGLKVGLDGKASKKHLECYWWRHTHRCRFSDSDCTCAHYTTGLVAEEPMPRDTIRRIPSQPAVIPHHNPDLPYALHERSPSYSPPPPSITPRDPAVGKEIKPPVEPRSSEMPPKVQDELSSHGAPPTREIDIGTDPRLRRVATSELPVKNALDERDPMPLDQNADPDKSHHTSDNTIHERPPARKLIMKSCRDCSRLIFKADVCTDCLRSVQGRDCEPKNTANETTGQENVDKEDNEEDVDFMETPFDKLGATAEAHTAPAPKILKRKRSGSGSNLFASKRTRPSMTTIRSNTNELPGTSNKSKIAQPCTLEQLIFANAQKAEETKEIDQDMEQKQQISEETVDDVQNISPSVSTVQVGDPQSLSPPVSPTTRVEYPRSTLADSSKATQQLMLGGIKSDATEMLREAYAEPGQVSPRSESPMSCCDSDTPLADLRSRKDKPLWSPSTSNPSPQTIRVVPVTKTARPAVGPTPRCRTCIKYHRKCVHSISGEFDRRKCYEWQQERNQNGSRQKAHYSESERLTIKSLAEEYEAELGELEEESDEDVDPLHEDSLLLSPIGAGKSVASGTLVSTPHELESQKAAFRSPTPDYRQPSSSSQRPPSGGQAHHHNIRRPEAIQDEHIAGIIARLKARGAVFEDSDSEDVLDDDESHGMGLDERIDPLLRHKQTDRPPTPILRCPKITKGQGLKNPQAITRRQMARNFQLFGNAHKEVDRRIPQARVMAMIQKKDTNDVLAIPEEVEEEMTFQEFLGICGGKEMEPCLGKVALSRGKFTMELAFREQETGPELGVWGRERRGSKRERVAFVVGQ